MKTLRLRRVVIGYHATYGVLVDPELQPICVTLEDPWMDNMKNISCIPEGVYICREVESGRFGWSWYVQDVPGRSGILFHAGNWAGERGVSSGTGAGDTTGCILLGQSFGVPRIIGADGRVGVVSSRRAMEKFHKLLEDETKFCLIVESIDEEAQTKSYI